MSVVSYQYITHLPVPTEYIWPTSQPGTIDGCIAACGQLNFTFAGGEVHK